MTSFEDLYSVSIKELHRESSSRELLGHLNVLNDLMGLQYLKPTILSLKFNHKKMSIEPTIPFHEFLQKKTVYIHKVFTSIYKLSRLPIFHLIATMISSWLLEQNKFSQVLSHMILGGYDRGNILVLSPVLSILFLKKIADLQGSNFARQGLTSYRYKYAIFKRIHKG